MADWFETRFREAGEPERLDPAFATRMRSLVVEEWRSTSTRPFAPDDDTHDDNDNDNELGEIIMLETEERTTFDEGPPPPRRRSPRWLLGAAAAVTVAVLGGALLFDGDDREVDTAASTARSEPGAGPALDAPAKEVPQVEDFPPLEAGRWFVDPDGDDATPMRVSFEVPSDGWVAWPGAANFSGASHIALSTLTIDNLVTNACTDHTPQDPPVGPTVDDLATALTQLRPFEVTSPPRETTVDGYEGTHLQLTVPDLPVVTERGEARFEGCTVGRLESWYSPLHDNGTRAFFGYNGEPGRTEDFWILDVEGTRLVLSLTFGPGSLPDDVAELDDILGSLRIEP